MQRTANSRPVWKALLKRETPLLLPCAHDALSARLIERHGNGAGGLGTQTSGNGPLDCDSCHLQAGLSGEHALHLDEGLACEECHSNVLGTTVSLPDEHVDGVVQTALPIDIVFNGTTCTGTCHNEVHSNRIW